MKANCKITNQTLVRTRLKLNRNMNCGNDCHPSLKISGTNITGTKYQTEKT